jgi:hypothetical protein
MKRSALVILAGLAALAVVAAASSRAPAVAVPKATQAPSKGLRPLLAVVPGERGPVLGRADKRAIWVARRSPKLRIFNQLIAWAYAPDGSAIVLATQPDGEDSAVKLQFIDPIAVVRRALVRLTDGNVAGLAWGDGRLNVLLQNWDAREVEVVSVDAVTHRVSKGATVSGSAFAVERAGARLVFLLAPAQGIGLARLAVVDPDGALRSVELPQTSAGWEFPNDPSDAARARQNVPGLAVDPDSGTALVVSASGQIAKVSLSTLTVSYHSLAQPVSLVGRLHDWIEPKAEAKGVNGPVRIARWLGSGVIGVTGGDETASVGPDKQLHFTWSPAGLTLIDTNTWGTKVIDRGADSFVVDGDTLLVTGSSWSDADRTGMGLAAYGFDGTQKLSLLRGESAYLILSFRGKAYLSMADSNAVTVVDLAQGKVAGVRHAPVAQLLLGDGSG